MRKLLLLPAAASLALTSLLVGGPIAFAEEIQCSGTIGAVTLDNIFVPDGQTCVLNGTRVQGTVTVGTGATLQATGVRVNGNIQAEGARSVVVGDSSVEDSIASSFVGGSIQIVQGGSATIDRAIINGNLFFDANLGAVYATRNNVGGNLQAFQNIGGVSIANNLIAQNLQCKENAPPPTGDGNSAGNKEDQCASL